jgi:hypothetical protein
VDSKMVSHDAYSIEDRVALIVVSFLSLGIWVAIWGAVASMFSAAL